MRIALISEHASPLAVIGGIDSGGQNIYVANVARCLASQGHMVDVFTRWDNPDLPAIVTVAPGCRVIHVAAGPREFVPKERLLGLMSEFAAFCADWMRMVQRYDVIHANFFMSGWVGLRLKEYFHIPMVTTFHALGKVRREHQQEADAFPLERIAIEHAVAVESDRIVAECPQDLEDLERLYGVHPRRIDMIPCGFDAKEFSPGSRTEARRRLHIAADEFMVLQLGRMVPRKGVDTVVRALSHLDSAKVRLRIVGGDCDVADPVATPEIGRLMKMAAELGVKDRVVFEGRKARDVLKDWYAAANVFVTTPWYEPFGITPLEAMACARPVIGSEVGGLKYSIEHGVTGLLVPPKDPEALAVAIASLQADCQVAAKMGEAGLSRATRLFTWDGIARQLATTFVEVTASPRRHRIHPAPMAHQVREHGVRAPAIFLDKDGTLIEDVPYNVDPARLRIMPFAIEALRAWKDAGYRVVVVTNQPGIGLGLFSSHALEELHCSLGARLAREDAPIDGFFACPHRIDEQCRCRKPQPDLILLAAEALNLDLQSSWMIGDILNDVEAGRRAGCRTVLIDVGNETEWVGGYLRTPDYRCSDLLQAAGLILGWPDLPSSWRARPASHVGASL